MLSTTLSVALAIAPSLPQQQPQTSTELLPLQHLCMQPRDHSTPPWGSLLRYREDGGGHDFVLRDGSLGSIDPDAILDALNSFESEAVDNERLFLQAIENNLLAVGERKSVLRVRKHLDEAASILARPVQVEFAIWNAAGREVPKTTLDAAGFEAFSANHNPTWRAVGTASAGRPLALEHMTWSRYVRGIEVEVAQKMTLSRPATDRYGEGGNAAVRTYALVGSDEFAVHLQFAVAERRGVVRTLQTGLQGAPDIELPRLESYFGMCSGRIPNGGALCATMRGDASGGGQITITLRVTSSTAPTQLSDATAALLPVGALVTDGLSLSADLPNVQLETDERNIDESIVHGQVPRENLVNLIEGLLSASEQDAEYETRCGGGYLFVRGSPQAIASVTLLVKSLQDRLVRNAQIRHEALLQPVSREPGDERARSPLHELSMPSLLGREVAAYRLHETNVVADVFIEVAAEAGSLVPSVRRLQSGTWLRARAVPVRQSLHVDLDVLTAFAPVPPMRSVMPSGGVLMQSEVASTQLHHEGLVASGSKIEHGDGPRVTLEGRNYRSTLRTTVQR